MKYKSSLYIYVYIYIYSEYIWICVKAEIVTVDFQTADFLADFSFKTGRFSKSLNLPICFQFFNVDCQ